MKNQLKFIPLLAVLSLAFAIPALADNITLTASDSSGHTSLSPTEAQIHWSDGNPPNATNDYFTGPFFVRTPGNNAGITFAGHSLTLQDVSGNPGTGGQGAPYRSILYKGTGGDTITINNLTNSAGSVLNNGGSGNVTAPTFTGNQWTIAGNSTIISDQGATIIGYPIVGSANLTNSGSVQSGVHSISYIGNLSGFTGKLILANVNGGMVVNLNSGSGNLGNPATSTPDQITIANGCALADNIGLTFNNANGGFTLSGGNGSINAAANTVIAEPITDLTNGVPSRASLTAGGAGTLVLNNANNTYSGGTTISTGILQLGVDNAIPGNTVGGDVTDNGTLDMNGHNLTINGLSGSGTVDTFAGGTPTLTIGANGDSGTFSGTIQNSSGTLSVTKVGAGTETISGAYLISGVTMVASGTLNLNSALGSASTPGSFVIASGNTMTANTSLGNPFVVNNLVIGTNSTLNLTLNPSANGINAAGSVTFQDNATNNFNYGTVTGNPTALAINMAGSLFATGSNIVINIAATGLQPGTFALIKYTGTPLASIANFHVSPPPGVIATLQNNMANDSIDLHITSIPNQLAWNGVNGTSWDLTTPNWTNTVAGGITVFRQYTNGTVIAGDAVTFDDTLTNDFVNPQPTNIILNSTFYAFPVVVNSTLPYSISGSGGITGITSLVLSNTGSMTLLTSNSFTGGVNIAGPTLIITNDSALGASSGAVTLNGGTLRIAGGVTNSRALPMPVASTISVATNITASLGGTISGGGANFNKSGNGTLILTARETFTGDMFLHTGTTIIDSGGSFTNANYNDVGQNTTDTATLTLQGTGSLRTTSDFNLGDLDSSIGTLNMSGSATLTVNAFYIGSANASGSTAMGIVNQTGGTVTEISTAVGTFSIGGRTSTSGVGIYNLSGGTVTANAGIRVGGTGVGTLNQSGGTLNALGGINIARIAGSFGTNNLNGGMLSTFNVASSTGTNAVFNFNGGTLQANFAPPGATWFSGGIQANILAGGAIIDSSNNNVTVSVPLLAGSANGGLTKKGTGTLNLTGTNTFTGPITNNAGTLFLNSPSTYAGGAVVNAGTLQVTTASTIQGTTTVGNNTLLSVNQLGSAILTMGNLTFNGAANGAGATLGLTPTSGNNPNVAMVNCGTLTLNGTNTISLAAVNVGTTALIQYTGALAGSGNITNLSLPQGAIGYVTNIAANSTLYVVITSAGPGLVWTGTNSVSPNVWDIGITTNWLVNSTSTSYHQIITPGDAVAFNDNGSGTVALNTNVAPAGIVISNSSTAYTFSGSGNITGPTGLVKLGSGTAIFNLANDSYIGNTVISNGTLQLGSASALSGAANLVMGAGGTLELAGFSPTVGELTGSGIIDNASGLNPILTVGSSSGGTWNGTIKDHGAGGVTLHKVGSGTWVVGGTNYLNDGQPFSDQSLISAGTVSITNGGLLSVGALQLRIADVAGQAASVVVAGGTLAVSNNVLSVGYNTNTAGGTLTVNSGTVFHGGPGGGDFAAVAESIDVGAQGATGTLIVNGGQVLNNSELILGDGAASVATLYLNGGLLQAANVLANGSPTVGPVAYFNGGTLQATTNSSSFLNGITANVMSNGLALDDGGFTVSIGATSLLMGDAFNGGLVKKGSGTVYLDTYNSYTGTTIVTNGTLAGGGIISGPVVVGPAGNLGAGDAGTTVGSPLSIYGNLTLHGTVTFRISNNGGFAQSDQISGVATVNFGGTLAINNVTSDATPLTSGETFQLFSTPTGHSGNFVSIVGSPGAGLGYSFDPASGILSVVTATAPTALKFTASPVISGTSLTISVQNTGGGTFYLLTSTNITSPLNTWTPVWTNTASSSGTITTNISNIVNPALGRQFYILSTTHN